MNEYNHHRIIERVALDCGLDASIKKIFIEASDFTDFFIGAFNSMKIWEWKDTAKQKYFFYRFYYTININSSNTIRLNRVTSNGFIGNNSIECMENAGEKGLDGKYSLSGWNSLNDEKEFFSSVNDRKRSPHTDKGDTANQSDNVAFLHAMGAAGETAGDTREATGAKIKTSRSVFEDHIKKCFAEYLFLEDEEEALFMLGIAFHGIMDSFTPSHMGFQKYTEQDMGLHAQGDVIPIMGRFNEEETVCFDPGQFKKEIIRNKLFFPGVKYYNSDAIVNPVEYKMLRIFFYISDIQVDYGNGWGGVGDIDEFWKTFKGCTLKQINDILGHGRYRYGPKSYVYSEAAIKVISGIYKLLCDEREKCKSYTSYKDKKEGIVDKALKYWSKIYDGEPMKGIREEHLGLSLYSKDPELEDWKAQQEIGRIDRLKG